MAYTVVIQPTGLLALFDSVHQELVIFDTDEKGIVDYMVERAGIVERVTNMTAKAHAGKTRIDYGKAIDKMVKAHGEEAAFDIVSRMIPETPPAT